MKKNKTKKQNKIEINELRKSKKENTLKSDTQFMLKHKKKR